jgi:hypothetical protein
MQKKEKKERVSKKDSRRKRIKASEREKVRDKIREESLGGR